MLVCFDTHVLIWGVKGEAVASQRHMIERTRAFIAHLTEKQATVLVPSVVVGELLMDTPAEQHQHMISILSKSFVVAPFDLQAAAHFGRIWQIQRSQQITHDLQSLGATRQELKADCMIVATAVARGASCIYSNDVKLQKFALGHIDVYEIPDIPTQMKLFGEDQS